MSELNVGPHMIVDLCSFFNMWTENLQHLCEVGNLWKMVELYELKKHSDG